MYGRVRALCRSTPSLSAAALRLRALPRQEQLGTRQLHPGAAIVWGVPRRGSSCKGLHYSRGKIHAHAGSSGEGMAASSESDRQGAPDGEESQEVSSQTSSRGLDELPFNSEYNNRLVISYEGTEYCGWQLQREGVKTIQGELEAVLMKVLKEDRVTLAVQAAGRTDAGVHARHQVTLATFTD
eukprot:scaffold5337_cov411-Prasinococcus_capsulatus_cf.AAC.15